MLVTTLRAPAARPYLVVTNDASRSPATVARRFAGLGLPITSEYIVTSGELIPPYFARHDLVGARTCVLGPADSGGLRARAGGTVVPLAPGMTIDCLAVCDDDGFAFLPGIELALSAAVRALDAGRGVTLILPIPHFGVFEARVDGVSSSASPPAPSRCCSRRRCAAVSRGRAALLSPRQARAPPVRSAAERLGTPKLLLMIGDQLETDVVGARAAGLDVALVDGVSRWQHAAAAAPAVPTWILADHLRFSRSRTSTP